VDRRIIWSIEARQSVILRRHSRRIGPPPRSIGHQCFQTLRNLFGTFDCVLNVSRGGAICCRDESASMARASASRFGWGIEIPGTPAPRSCVRGYLSVTPVAGKKRTRLRRTANITRRGDG